MKLKFKWRKKIRANMLAKYGSQQVYIPFQNPRNDSL